jgi:hypothetical protein
VQADAETKTEQKVVYAHMVADTARLLLSFVADLMFEDLKGFRGVEFSVMVEDESGAPISVQEKVFQTDH